MFRNFVYLDEKAVACYAAQLGLGNGDRFDLRKARVSASLGIASAELEAEKSKLEVSNFVLYDQFEKQLSTLEGVDYFDFTEGKYDYETLPPGSMFKFRGYISVPEEFDMIETMGKFAPLLKGTAFLESDEQGTAEQFLLSLLNGRNAQIPVLLEGLGIGVTSKLKTGYLSEDGSLDIEAIEDIEAVFLCKVESYSEESKVAIYDPLRDFMKLGRAVRRKAKRGEGLESIEVDGPILKAELISIYH